MSKFTDQHIRGKLSTKEPNPQAKYPARSASPDNIRLGRFGYALFLTAIFALLNALLSGDIFMRNLLIFAATVCALFAGFFIDSANKKLKQNNAN